MRRDGALLDSGLRDSRLHDDLLAWLSPGGLLLTALMLRFPVWLRALRAIAPELTLPT